MLCPPPPCGEACGELSRAELGEGAEAEPASSAIASAMGIPIVTPASCASREQAATHWPCREGASSTTGRPASSGLLMSSRCTGQFGSQRARTRFMDVTGLRVNFQHDFAFLLAEPSAAAH
jgi:hypothetical protein